MAGISNVSNIWNTVKEVDLRPLRQEALSLVKIAIVGTPGVGRAALADHMRNDPSHPEQLTEAPVQILDLEHAQQAVEADLIILILNPQDADFTRQKELVKQWANANRKVLVLVNRALITGEIQGRGTWMSANKGRVLYGSLGDTNFLLKEFVPAVMELLPGQLLSLGRNFPLFREAIAHELIVDTCLSNAAYSLSTGIAEIVPVFDIPLNIADMFVLTKTQAFLVYKLGLELGFSTRWQDYIAEFGGVLGSGFVWRQLARSLVGLIPVFGIVPKMAISYAGTFVVGNVVLQWYLTGRHISREQMSQLYQQSFEHGKQIARNLLTIMPRPGGRNRKKAKQQALTATASQVCPDCGRTSAADATFCQYCGHPFTKLLTEPSDQGKQATNQV